MASEGAREPRTHTRKVPTTQSIDKIEPVCYYITMKTLKIYRDGKYDIKANIALKIRVHAPIILQKLDDGFNKLYEY